MGNSTHIECSEQQWNDVRRSVTELSIPLAAGS